MSEEIKKKKGTIIKVIAVKRPINNEPNNKYDSLIIYYRDENGKKQKKFIARAEVPYYLLKDKESPEAESPPMFIQADKVEKFSVSSDMLLREIAVKTGCLGYYQQMTMQGRAGSGKNVLKHPLVYDADMDISDRAIQKFHEEFEPDNEYVLHKCFYDIEVDLMADGEHIHVGFPDEDIAPCPVVLITLFDQKAMTFHCFICNEEKNISMQEVIGTEESQKEFIDFVKKWLKEKDNFEDDIEIKLHVEKDEATTIVEFFKLVHEIDPDFCCAWNAGYDCNTMLNRLGQLRSKDKTYIANYNQIKGTNFSGKDIAGREISKEEDFYFIDTQGRNGVLTFRPYYKQEKNKQIVDRTESFTILDGTTWFDQMGLYASIRKTSGQRESYSLDAIANEELKKEKLPFEPGESIKTICWKNFRKYLHYNIVDVLRLYQLEKKNLDLDMIQRLSEITNTRKEKVFKKTVSVKNLVSKFARDNGYIMTDNRNAQYGTEEDSNLFKSQFLSSVPIYEEDENYLKAFLKKENYGAYVGNPLLNAEEGIKIFGKNSAFIFEMVGDQDFAALYPSIIRALNLDSTTQRGKFFWLDSKIKENLIKNYDYDGLFSVSKNEDAESDSTSESTSDVATTLVDSLQSQDWEKIGEKFFLLPTTTEIINDLKNKKGIK